LAADAAILRMTNIAAVLKAEITRLARREIRGEVASLRKASAQHRSTIAALRREVDQLRKQLRTAGKARSVPASEERSVQRRFRPAGLVAHRKKLGLSAESYGALVGVSGQSIHHWEGGQRPRAKQLEALAAVRAMGKRDAAKKLADLAESDARKTTGKKRRGRTAR
jgi:DNA-binding transcriptional regulator YiaG